MKLSVLAGETGVSTASIKYYIHVGILPPGRKRNATTADYSRAHVERLALISCLRTELGSPINSIAALTHAIADETLENIELMGICQRLALEAGNALGPTSTATGVSSPPASLSAGPEPADRAGSDRAGSDRAGSDRAGLHVEDDIRDVLDELEWPDVSPAAVTSMAHVLEELAASGYSIGPDLIRLHIHALAEVASRNTSPITDDLSRDKICLQVIRGITLHNRLLVATSALVHASLSAMPRTSHNDESQATKSV